ncbi:MAG: TfuA-like protein [Pseudomonadota bacterium]
MNTVVFLGPSLGLNAARQHLDAVYLPPARRGDVVRAIEAHDPETILIIDGYFEQVPSVWHKEILWALSHGRTVAGAASMGALRATELDQFGMIGVGRIYDAYSKGRFDPFPDPFEDDDEVAVLHGPAETGYAATEAMVDVRATLDQAQQDGILQDIAMHELAAAAKALFYKYRTWGRILADANALPDATRRALEDWLKTGRVPQKRLDAEGLLCQTARRELVADVPPFRFEETVLWDTEFPKIVEKLSK